MSWLYSQALVVEYLAASCSDGAPFAPLSGKPTPQAYCAPDRTTAHSRLSRFGMTCAPLMADRGVELLTWYLAAFHAKTSVARAKVLESKASAVECGQKWPESLARYDHASRSWKTAQCSLLEGLDVYSETWPRWGTMRGGECWAQLMPVLRTSATASGLWPTATARDWKGANTEQGLTRKDGKSRMDQLANAVAWPTPTTEGIDGGSNSRKAAKARGMWPTAVARWLTPTAMDASPVTGGDLYQTATGSVRARYGDTSSNRGLAAQVMWPTPTRMDAHGSHLMNDPEHWRWRRDAKARDGINLQFPLRVAVQMWPTPTAWDWKDGTAETAATVPENGLLVRAIHLRHEPQPVDGGSLNPTWVEWLMGWPLGWTDCAASATDRFRQWHASHGAY